MLHDHCLSHFVHRETPALAAPQQRGRDSAALPGGADRRHATHSATVAPATSWNVAWSRSSKVPPHQPPAIRAGASDRKQNGRNANHPKQNRDQNRAGWLAGPAALTRCPPKGRPCSGDPTPRIYLSKAGGVFGVKIWLRRSSIFKIQENYNSKRLPYPSRPTQEAVRPRSAQSVFRALFLSRAPAPRTTN